MDKLLGGDTIGEIIIMKLNEEEKRFLKISLYFTASFRNVSWIYEEAMRCSLIHQRIMRFG